MIKSYTQRFYPNPFRYRKLNAIKNLDDIFEKIRQNLRPFLNENFLVVHDYIDEFDNLQSETKLTRIFRNKINSSSSLTNNKSKLLSESLLKFISEKNYLNNYQKNLRFLELPVHPKTDKKGFEIQSISTDIIEDTIEEIDEGLSFIYDYCSRTFPEAIDLWNDYALSTPNEFPYIAHDNFLETSYEVFDKIFDDLQKNSINLFKWVISGDINSKIIKVIKPDLKSTQLKNLWILVESLLSLIVLILVIQYTLRYSLLIKSNKNKKIFLNPVKRAVSVVKKEIGLKKFRVHQKVKKLKIRLINLKTNCKYRIFKSLTTTTN